MVPEKEGPRVEIKPCPLRTCDGRVCELPLMFKMTSRPEYFQRLGLQAGLLDPVIAAAGVADFRGHAFRVRRCRHVAGEGFDMI
jgi:hypothetical protein